MRYMSFEDISSTFFFQDMESSKSVHGDLTDVIRGGGGGGGGGLLSPTDDVAVIDTVVGASRLSPRPIKPDPAGSAPRAPGVKRRKGQAKKVICIPAPAADQESINKMNSSSGVVVPSDLWAWRKYGQKPIKGSPYPRGYYRCSSSKACLARKQVERSRSDPSMLVITYTAEHNHPWPTHRNSLAGSSRSSNPNNAKKNSTTSTHHNQKLQETTIKEEENIEEFERVFDQKSCEPLVMLESNNDIEFFDELGGLEPDPMSFFLPSREGLIDNIDLDPLSYFDWYENKLSF